MVYKKIRQEILLINNKFKGPELFFQIITKLKVYNKII